jgi:membrane protein required for colicin V production
VSAGFASLGAVDLTMLAVLLLSVGVGLWRGLWLEVAMLVGWLVAYFCAQWFAPEVAPHLPLGSPGSGLNRAAAFALVFVGAVIVWALAARLVRLLIQATPLSVVDRLGGGAFGLLRGAVLLLAAATLVGFTPAAQSSVWQASTGARWAAEALGFIHPLLPPDLRQWLPGS